MIVTLISQNQWRIAKDGLIFLLQHRQDPTTPWEDLTGVVTVFQTKELSVAIGALVVYSSPDFKGRIEEFFLYKTGRTET